MLRRIALAVVCAVLACRKADANDPNTWLSRLDSPDSRERIEAVENLRRLKAKEAGPRVAALLRDPLVKEVAASALQDLGGPSDVPALLEAVDTTVGAGSDMAARTANRANRTIAEAIGDIAAKGRV